MALYALIIDGAVAEIRDVDPAEISTTKFASDGGSMLRPFTDAPAPVFCEALETCVSTYQIDDDEVTRVWTVARRPIADQIRAIDAESSRRIDSVRDTRWREILQARATFLLLQQINSGALTESEQSELDALNAFFSWCMGIIVAANTLKAADPIPLDFAADIHWPAPPQ